MGLPLFLGSLPDRSGGIRTTRGLRWTERGTSWLPLGNNRVQKLSPGGTLITEWGSWGQITDSSTAPPRIALDPQGLIYVTDQLNNRVQKVDGNGVYITQWGSEGPGKDSSGSPRSIAMTPAANVSCPTGWTASRKFTVEGTFRSSGASRVPGSIRVIREPDRDQDGYRWRRVVAEAGNNRVQKFDGNGIWITRWGLAS